MVNRPGLILMALVSVLILWFVGSVFAAESFTIVNPYAIDGDTLKDAQGQRIRIWGINSPEIRDPGGEQAKAFMAEMVEKQIVVCDIAGYDHWNRVVARCFIHGIDIACPMIAAKLAVDVPKYSRGFYKLTRLNVRKRCFR